VAKPRESSSRRKALEGFFAPEEKFKPALERKFQAAFADIVKRKAALGQRLNANPDDPRHFFNHRAAFKAGALGVDEAGHGSSRFKRAGHPNLIINGVDTRTGRKASEATISTNRRIQNETRRREGVRKRVAP